MKKVIYLLVVATLNCGNVFSQAKKSPVKRTSTSPLTNEHNSQR